MAENGELQLGEIKRPLGNYTGGGGMVVPMAPLARKLYPEIMAD